MKKVYLDFAGIDPKEAQLCKYAEFDMRIMPPEKYAEDEILWEDFVGFFWETALMGVWQTYTGDNLPVDWANMELDAIEDGYELQTTVLLIPTHELQTNFSQFTDLLLTILPDEMTSVDIEGVNYIAFIYEN